GNSRKPSARKATRKKPRASPAGSCWFSTPARRARSTPRLPRCAKGAWMRYSSVPIRSLSSRRQQIVALAARDAIPTMDTNREFIEEGGLISYGNDTADGYVRAGVYAGRILNGAKPSDLPVDQATKFELVVNVKAAKAIGLTIPESFLARADEVIE